MYVVRLKRVCCVTLYCVINAEQRRIPKNFVFWNIVNCDCCLNGTWFPSRPFSFPLNEKGQKCNITDQNRDKITFYHFFFCLSSNISLSDKRYSLSIEFATITNNFGASTQEVYRISSGSIELAVTLEHFPIPQRCYDSKAHLEPIERCCVSQRKIHIM